MSNFFKENKLKQNENTKMIRNRRSKDIGDFILQDKIGSLPYGKRYKVKEKKTGEIYTASIFDNNIYESIDEQTNLSYMIEEMSELKHPTLQQFFGICPISVKNEPKTAVITERATDMTLHNLIRSDNKSNSNELNETRKLIIIYGIALGMSYLHSHDVIHGDLNSGNILIDDFFFSKINGFGLSKISNIQKVDNLTIRSIIGSKESSPIYKSPEVLKGEKITKSSDVYSFGVVVYEIMTNLNPQENFNILDNLTEMRRGSYLKHEFNIPLSYHELIEKCLLKEPTKRPTFEEIINELTEEERFITSKVNQDDYLNYIKYIESYEFTKNVPPNKFLHSYTKTKIEESNNKNIIAIENFNNNLYPSRYFIQLKEECKTLVKESEQDFEKQFLVGQYLIEGSYHFPQNTQLGLKYLKNSFKNGYLKSLIYYCKMLIKGDIIPKNHAKVKKILENNLKDQETIYNLIYGLMLKNENKFIEALSYFEKSKNEEDGEIIYEYAKILHKICESKEDKDKCIEYFQKSIDKQYLRAMYKYGLMLIKGTIASNKKEDGINLIKAAAEKGDLKSLYYYSSILEETGENKEEYMKFLKQAALKSHIESMYKYGIELSKENIKYDEYLILLKKASNKGHMKSIYQYGMSCQTEEESSLYLKIASDHGNSEAMYLYGYNLETGKGVPIDKEESLKYIKMSMEQGNTNAIVLYALRLYLFGKENDKLESIKFLKNAIDKGNSYAMAFYASILLYENSIQESMKYYKMGIDKDNIIAMNKYSINNEEESTDLIKHCHAKIRIEDIMNYYSFLLDYTNDSISYSNDSNISPNEEHSKSNSDEKKRKIIESFINNLNLKSNDSESDLIYDESYLPSSDLYSTENIFDSYPLLNLADFDILEKIETNKLSNVFKIQSKTTGELFLAQSFLYNQYHLLFQICIKHIIEKLAKFKHPSIVNFVGYSPFDFDDQPKPVIIKEFPSNGSLRSIFENKGKINNSNSWDSTTKLITIYGIATGMKHLHSHYIDQYELIPENILFDHHFYPKINFEFTTKNQSTEKILNIPKIYRAPETYEKEEYTESSEVYTFSMIIYEIITNKRPFKSIEENEIKEEITINNYRPPIPKSIPKCYKELIESCWSQDPRQRPTFETIVNILELNSDFITNDINRQTYKDYIEYLNINFNESKTKSSSNIILDIKKYTKLKKIGAGYSSKVYKIKNNYTNEFYAAKILKIKKDKDYHINLQREMKISLKLNHPSILKFYGISPIDFQNEPKIVIISELAQSSTLNDILDNERKSFAPIEWNSTKKLINIYGIASGMKYLHSLDIIHRDLKPANILLDQYLFPKISDFGLSKELKNNKNQTISNSNNIKGTMIYIAPEIFDNYIYSKAGDVYAFGLIVYELIVGEKPFENLNSITMVSQITKGYRPEFTFQIPDCYRKLIEACWSHDMYKRPTFSEIVDYLEKNESIRKDIDNDEFDNYIVYVEGHLPFDDDSTKSFIKIDADYIKFKKPNYLELSQNVEIIDIQKFDKVSKLGYGGYGKVYKVTDKETKRVFAAKILKNEITFLEEIEQIYFSREVNIISQLKHESIIKFYGYSQYNFKGKLKPSYIMELAYNQSLRKVLSSERQQHSNKFNNTKKFINIYGIVSVLKYLHSLDILHRDLKTDNIMLDEYLYPKLIDFGFSKELSEKLINVKSNALGTPAYVAPETWINGEHSKASDVYSFSMILYEILTNEIPFSKFIDKYQIYIQVTMNHYRPFINKNVPNCYRKLIESCWSENPGDRPTFEEILYKIKSDHNFILDDVDFNEFLLYTKKIGDDYITFNKLNEPQEKYEQSIEKVNLQLGEEKVNENTINVFNTVIKDEKQDKNYYIDINDYERQELIQEGDINKIHEVKDKKSGKIYEARISNIDMNQFSIEEIQQICIEMNKLSHLKHQSILRINGFSPKNFKNESKPVFITEITSKTTLSNVLELDRSNIQNPILDSTKKLINIYGIASGMKYLHSHDILHRNLKPSNILLDESNYPKLSDFGMCNHLLIMNSVTFQSITKMQNNSYYQAPEILNSESHTKESDVYSFAMIVYEILTLEKPMNRCKDFSSLYKEIYMKGNRPKLLKSIPNFYRELIENCWCQTPRERITFDEIVSILRNDPSFITSDINQKEYYEYIENDDKFTE